MKKIAFALLLVVMAFALCACGGGEATDGGESNAVDFGWFTCVYPEGFGESAEYLGYEILKDSDGADAIVCTYNFTNNSEEAQSFDWAWLYTYFQDGVELDYSVVFLSEDSFDCYDDTATDIQPGNSLEVKTTYKLNSLESPVEVEFVDFYSDDTDGFTIELQ